MPWKAPANAAGKTIEFRFSAVQTRTLFWTGKLANHTIVVVDSSLDGDETSSMAPTTTESTASTNSTPLASSPINSTTASDCLLTIDCPLTTSVMPPLSPSTEKELTSIKPNTSASSVPLTKPISVTTSKSPQSTSSVIVTPPSIAISSMMSSQLTTTTTKVTAVSSPIKSSSTNKPTGWGTGSVTTLKETTSSTPENQVLTNTLWPISSTISTTIIAMNETSTTTLHQPAKNETALTLTTSNLTLTTTVKTCSCGGGHITSTTASPTTTTSSSEIILPSILVISVCFLRFLMRT